MRPDEDFTESGRQAGASLAVYCCLENAPEHSCLDGIIFHNIPLFSTVMELIPSVKGCVNIKYEFCRGKCYWNHIIAKWQGYGSDVFFRDFLNCQMVANVGVGNV